MFEIFGPGMVSIAMLVVCAAIIGGIIFVTKTMTLAQQTKRMIQEIELLRASNADLFAANDRLRDELERLKGSSEKKDPPRRYLRWTCPLIQRQRLAAVGRKDRAKDGERH